jgi:hypothetical protein
MQKLIAWIKMIPGLFEAIRHVEEAIPLPSTGQQKLNLLLEIIHAFYDVEESLRHDFPWEKLAALVTATSARIVTALNALGLFHHQASGAGQGQSPESEGAHAAPGAILA